MESTKISLKYKLSVGHSVVRNGRCSMLVFENGIKNVREYQLQNQTTAKFRQLGEKAV